MAGLEREADALLRALHAGESAAIADFREHHPGGVDPGSATLADARLALARSYEAPSWERIVEAATLVDAIWHDDLEAVRELVTRNPRLLFEPAIVRRDSNWGPPLTYAANLGRDRIIEMLRDLGATDLESALDRAALQGRIGTAHRLHGWL